ncbi:MAG: P-loop NTPase fold protein [Pseudomonadota bacterium]
MRLSDIREGGKRAVANAITRLETHPRDPAVIALLDEAFEARFGVAIGITGPPGVGKSSLTQALIDELRRRDKSVAIVAVDPSSARTGGALLGDRTRIETDPSDQGVFMRSMAARGSLGGLSAIAFPAVVLLRALFDIVLVETVGVGQSEIEVAERTDGVVFCAQPGSGDALQFMKAGVMEIPDVVFITKGDMGDLARRAAADLKGAFSLDTRGESVPFEVVSSRTGEGISPATDVLLSRLVAPTLSQSGVEKRRLQGEAWALDYLRLRFGEAGLSYVKQAFVGRRSPFGQMSDLEQQLEAALRRGWSGVESAKTPLAEKV